MNKSSILTNGGTLVTRIQTARSKNDVNDAGVQNIEKAADEYVKRVDAFIKSAQNRAAKAAENKRRQQAEAERKRKLAAQQARLNAARAKVRGAMNKLSKTNAGLSLGNVRAGVNAGVRVSVKNRAAAFDRQ